MMLSEFEKLTGLEVTTAEYEKIEAEYKSLFVKSKKKNKEMRL